jgi:putative transcriptional regulator
MTGDMTFEEKTTYGQAIITLCSYLIYLGLVLSRARDVPLAGVQYVPVLLWTAGAAVVASILNCILVACIWPRVRTEGHPRQANRPLWRIRGPIAALRRWTGGADPVDARDRPLLERQRHLPEFHIVGTAGGGREDRLVSQGVPLRVSKTRVTNCIRALRFAREEMTQADLADRVGVTRQTIIAIEQGRYSPSLEMAFRIAEALGVPLDEVFGYARNGRNEKGTQ